jgi:hypothetical protein
MPRQRAIARMLHLDALQRTGAPTTDPHLLLHSQPPVIELILRKIWLNPLEL